VLFELREQGEGLGAVPALDEDLAQLEGEVRVAWDGANQGFVLADGLVELALGLQDVDDFEMRVDVALVES
jgi:hypothetical protein